MDSLTIINKILSAKNYVSVFETSDYKKEYHKLARLIHPDYCSHEKAGEAMSKLNQFLEQIKKGLFYVDDAGRVNYFSNKMIIEGDKNLLSSIKQYNKSLKWI